MSFIISQKTEHIPVYSLGGALEKQGSALLVGLATGKAKVTVGRGSHGCLQAALRLPALPSDLPQQEHPSVDLLSCPPVLSSPGPSSLGDPWLRCVPGSRSLTSNHLLNTYSVLIMGRIAGVKTWSCPYKFSS